jgi:hypothetical protein
MGVTSENSQPALKPQRERGVMDTKVATFPVATKVLENPALIERLDEETNAKVLVDLLGALMPVVRQFVRYAVARDRGDAQLGGPGAHTQGSCGDTQTFAAEHFARLAQRAVSVHAVGWRIWWGARTALSGGLRPARAGLPFSQPRYLVDPDALCGAFGLPADSRTR